MTSEDLHDVLVAVENITEGISQIQVKNQLQHCKKVSSENLVKSALGGAHQWKVHHTMVGATDENNDVVAD